MYKVVSKPIFVIKCELSGEIEEIDRTDDYQEAKYLLSKYRTQGYSKVWIAVDVNKKKLEMM